MRALKADQPIFYVYEHWRPDTNECFWVGKGHGRRAWNMRRRNNWHSNIVRSLHSKGLEVDVRIVFDRMVEREALDLEIVWIAFWRDRSTQMTNVTIGGDGCSGSEHSLETRVRLSEIASRTLRGRPCSPETRERIAATQRGKKRGPNPKVSEKLKGRKLSEEHKAAIGRSGRGRVDPPDVRVRRAESNRGRQVSDLTRMLLSLSHRGYKPSEENLRKRSESCRAAWAKRKAAQNG